MFGFTNNFFRDTEYRFHRGIVLEHFFSRHYRTWVTAISGTIILVYLVLVLAMRGAPQMGSALLPSFDPTTPVVNGVFFIAIAVFLLMQMLKWYSRSYYFYVEALLERGKAGAQTPYTTPNYEVCNIYYETKSGDLLKSFCLSKQGERILWRLGIAEETVVRYLSARKTIIDFNKHTGDLAMVFTLSHLVQKLIELDHDFYQFLFELGIRDREVLGATEWVERIIKKKQQQQRFWGKVALGTAPTFGSEFAYGGAYALGKYSTDLSRRAAAGGQFRFVYGKEEIAQLEIVLSRSREANALLVGEDGTGTMDVVLDFARDITNGYTNPALMHKRVMAFKAASFVAGMRTKQELETGLIKILNDAVKAGNIIFVIEDFPGFVRSAQALGAEIIALLDPYLSGSALQVIATADNARFHSMLQPNNALMRHFEQVMLNEPAEVSLIRILEDVAEDTERRNRIFFTYPAITEIIRSAEQYFSDGVMPDKAIDLLVELTPSILARGGHLVKKLDVLIFIRAKTNIPVGEINADERDRLMNLEKSMKELVVGQEQALDVIADAMRRSRAGVRNMNRPIGTFLFLGPTGVGKTETAKALATVFFGDEKAMSRLDMTEYQGEDGLARMIGGVDGTTGTLAVMLKEHPYGVVLLDEFEKADPKVLDLFLQVLDEGIFHDAKGKKVNARNAIFIATSNAGAQEIRGAMADGAELESVKRSIVDKIIAGGKLKPELFNRFDGIILFHALTTPDYKKIAGLMLMKLQRRLREQNINLVVNDALVDAVMREGVDPEFGARPMARAVQDLVEKKVAEKIIAGNVAQGGTIEFTAEDF
jgi:ATP-dependent Clp protease ATP-binding subunit ClpA